jgi:chromosome segregation ATPase
MMKKAIVGSLAAATLGTMMFGGDAVSYMKSGFNEVHDAVRAEVPIEFELRRARDEVAALVPEIHKSLHVIAEQQVEVENLKATLDHKQVALEDQEEAILALNEDLKSGEAQFVYAGHRYTVAEVQRDLAERFNRFKVAEETVKAQQEILEAKQTALKAHTDTLEGMLSQKKDLEVQLERLEAKLRTVEARKQISSLEIDDSKLARAKSLIAEIDKKLDVEARLLDAEGNFTGLIPVETKSDVPVNISEQVARYFDGNPDELDAVDAKIVSLDEQDED